jgi:hypothetical protein
MVFQEFFFDLQVYFLILGRYGPNYINAVDDYI